MPRVLVTGGAGFIGSHLTDHLLATGHEVTVLDDFSTGRRDNLLDAMSDHRFRLCHGTIISADDLKVAIEGCEIVLHLAVRSVRHSIGDPIDNHHVNATGTLNVLEAARRHGVRRFVYCSSSEVYGNCGDTIMSEDRTICRPVTVYGGAKLAGEHYTLAYHQTYGLAAGVIRPFNAYGPRSHILGQSGEVIPRFAARILNGLRPIVFGDGSNARDFTFVTETAAGIAAAAKIDGTVGRVVNFGSGQSVSVGQLATTLAELCGRPDLGPEFRAARPGDVEMLKADLTRCRDVLGFTPKIGLRQGLETYTAWLRRTVNDVTTLLDDKDINWRAPT